MTTVTTEQVQKDFASVRELLHRGEAVALEENGIKLGTILPEPSQTPESKQRIFGGLEGKIRVPEDFDEMMREEIEEMFYGKQ